MSLVRVQDAAAEPVTDAELASHLRLDAYTARPSSAPTVALSDPAAPGGVDDGPHRYRCTFVTASGETDGGRISAPITIADASENGTVELAAIPVGGTGVTARKLYRTKADADDFFLLTTLADNTTTVYTDSTADSALGVGEPTTNATLNATLNDPVLPIYVAAARATVEQHTGRSIIAQQWRLTLDAFPSGSTAIPLGRPSLLTIDSVAYIDADGDPATLSVEDDITVDADAFIPAIRPVYGTSWPSTRATPNAVTITFTVGYGETAADVPGDLKAAILLLIGDLYRNREAQVVAVSIAANPTVAMLVQPYRVRDAA